MAYIATLCFLLYKYVVRNFQKQTIMTKETARTNLLFSTKIAGMKSLVETSLIDKGCLKGFGKGDIRVSDNIFESLNWITSTSRHKRGDLIITSPSEKPFDYGDRGRYEILTELDLLKFASVNERSQISPRSLHSNYRRAIALSGLVDRLNKRSEEYTYVLPGFEYADYLRGCNCKNINPEKEIGRLFFIGDMFFMDEICLCVFSLSWSPKSVDINVGCEVLYPSSPETVKIHDRFLVLKVLK